MARLKKQKTLIARYIMNVYGDGSTEMERLPIMDEYEKEEEDEAKDYIDCDEISSATAQSLLVIKAVISEFDCIAEACEDFEADIEVRYAIDKVAQKLNVNTKTIINKLTRDLLDDSKESVSTKGFVDMVDEYIEEVYKPNHSGICFQDADGKIIPGKDAKDTALFRAIMRSAPDKLNKGSKQAIHMFFDNPHVSILLKDKKTLL